ncbi:Uncharacterised protein [Staphylococcus aureus]|nr:Uncharacterised protein [Staphylococcus aureus]
MSAFAAGFSSFASLGALTSFVSVVGATTSLLATETALATGLASGAFSVVVVVGLATASVFGCASVFVPPVSSAAFASPFDINNKSVLIATDATPSDDFLIE